MIATGRPNPRAEPAVSHLAPGIVRVDGRMGFAPLALQMGAAPLAERARAQGIAALAVNNVFHIAALWPEVERLASALIGDLFSYEAGERDADGTGAPQGGGFMIAIDPARCAPGGDRSAALADAEQLFSRILEQDGARLPGQRRMAAREHTTVEGVRVPTRLIRRIRDLG